MNDSRVGAVLVGSAGIGLLSWLLVDASSVTSTFQLSGLVDEATVVLFGLATVGVCFIGAVMLMRRSMRLS